MAVQKQSEIKITVGLDENKIPETITWDATDGGVTFTHRSSSAY